MIFAWIFACMSAAATDSDELTDDTGTTDSGTTEEVHGSCDGLVFRAEARDRNGLCTSCIVGEVEIVGIVENPCDEDVAFVSTHEDCVVATWTLRDVMTDEETTESASCAAGDNPITIEAGEQIEDTHVFAPPFSSYEATVVFNDALAHEASVEFGMAYP